jgi:hypothetical protein
MVDFKDFLLKVIKETSNVSKDYRGLKVDRFQLKERSTWGGTYDYLVVCKSGKQELVWEVSIWQKDGQALASFEGSMEYYKRVQKELSLRK